MGIFGGKGEHHEIEERLRSERPAPSQELLTRLEAEVGTPAPAPRPSKARYGIAVGFAAGFAAIVAIVGGFALLPGVSTNEARATVVVPAAAVPAIRDIQERGARLAATPAGIAAAGTGTGSTLKPPKLKAIEIDTESPVQLEEKGSGSANGVTTLPLVPQVTSAVDVKRFAAASVYVPGTYLPVCYPVAIGGGDTLWIQIFVPSASLASFVPPGTFGLCPTGS